jgi:CRISPR-associated protein (TIGR03986 family)
MPETSILTVTTNKKNKTIVTIAVKTKKGSASQPVGLSLSSDLEAIKNSNPKELNGLEVHYEMTNGKVSKIWKKGSEWQASGIQSQPRRQVDTHRNTRNNYQQNRRPRQQQLNKDFHNPYNFVPSLPRDKINNDLGDHEPLGHHAYHDNHYSGWLEVELTTATPLLIPDAAQVTTTREDHKTFPVRVDANGVPYLPPTSIKGMLRAAYETVTNSRFGVFEKHEDRLAYRMEAHEGVRMIPAVVETGTHGLQLRLLTNRIPMTDNGKPENNTMYAAWLPYYYRNARLNITTYSNGSPIRHGDKVWVRCDKKEHSRPYFKYQSVTTIEPRQDGEKHRTGYQAGIVCITNQNINRKHDERVFLLTDNDPRLELSEYFITAWETLVDNYQKIHEDDLKKRKKEGDKPDKYLGNQPGKTGWSRHIYIKEAAKLKVGEICYAQIQDHKLRNLYPVMISRELFNEAPKDLLPDSLHLATAYEQLSPADRVFGWVNQDKNGEGSWKGQLRIGTAKCESGKKAIEKHGDDGFPLAILGEAKPQQTHFYVAKNKDGEPLKSENKADGYKTRTQGLRGRKVYPHHAHIAGLNNYWLQPREDRTQKPVVHKGKRYYQEYRRPTLKERGQDKTRDNQNRSILGWIKPDTKFHFKIHISNLSSVELGALLWLLNLDEKSYHRLGSAKPLGFGSVHLQIKDLELQEGQNWAKFYENLSESQIAPLNVETHIEAYKQAIKKAYGRTFDNVSFIKAFKVALRGFKTGLPVHYPRQDEKPNPQGESFKWFGENERKPGPHLALPALEAETGLPLLKR